MKMTFKFVKLLCFLLVLIRSIFLITKSCAKWVGLRLGRVQSFMLILGRVGSLHLWIGLGRVKKIGPTSKDKSTSYIILLFKMFAFYDKIVH